MLACKNTKTQTKSGFDREKIISEESAANLYYAWLLVLHTMLEHEAKTPEEVQRLWNAADQTVIQEVHKQLAADGGSEDHGIWAALSDAGIP